MFNIISDLALALMPLTFIPKMHRTAIEKLLLFSLLAAGLGATVVATVRVATLMGFYGQYPVAWLNIRTDILSSLEIFLGLIGASLPCLKGPTHRLLIRIGFIGSSASSGVAPDSLLYRLSHGRHIRRQLFRIADSMEEDKGSLPLSSSVRPSVPEPE